MISIQVFQSGRKPLHLLIQWWRHAEPGQTNRVQCRWMMEAGRGAAELDDEPQDAYDEAISLKSDQFGVSTIVRL